MFSVFRTFIMQRISNRMDAGRPLGSFLSWLTKNDQQIREFYEGLVQMEQRFREDLPDFLGERDISGIRTTQLPKKSQIVWDTSPKYARMTSANRLYRRVFWGTTAFAVSIMLVVGVGHYFLADNEAPRTSFSGREVAIGTPLAEHVTFDPFKDWNWQTLDVIAEESGNVLRQLPLFEPTASKALAFVLNDPATNAQHP
ncbi:MAG: hypothetical protein ACRC10_08360 [Thermoguttaceae bacterium]